MAATVAFSLTTGSVSASQILDDRFTDNVQDLPDSARWFRMATVADTVTVGSGKMTLSSPGSSVQALSYFTPSGSPVDIAVGQSLTVSFTLSTTGLTTASRGFHFGVFNSAGTRLTADTDAIPEATTTSYKGYGMRSNTLRNTSNDSTTNFNISKRVNNNTQLFSVGGAWDVYTGSQGFSFSNGTDYTLTLSLTNTGEGMQIVQTVMSGGTELLRMAHLDETDGYYTQFDTFSLYFQGVSSNSYSIDIKDFSVSLGQIPETSTTAALMGLVLCGGLVAYRSLRKRSAATC